MRFAILFILLLSSCSKSQVHTNALIHEASPYLLQHAHNPVDWLPWSDAAFEKARSENKPVFLSVGYAACHWCHVMEHESFENETIAAFLNENFVSIKVDREERPDVDHHYMQAVQKMTGSGGWPMSVFLTADRKPFYAGTYWPPEANYGRPGFMDVLKGLAKAWATQQDSVIASSIQLHESIHVEIDLPPSQSKLSPALFDNAVRESERNFDPKYGGFSKAPKFPHAMELAMLLRYYSRTGNDTVKHMVEFTLDNMARGGIFDQIGGGFHRYSTDEKWLVPHFEKMLYDNALLISIYDDAANVFGKDSYSVTAQKCKDWALNEMRLPEGGAASSLDADSEGEEGKFYVWTPKQIDVALNSNAGDFCKLFDITDQGNFEHSASIPNRLLSKLETVDATFLNGDRIEDANATLLKARDQRIAPTRDDKALCDWNGLFISALVKQGRIDEALVTAHRFILPFEQDGELVHSFLGEKELRVQLLLDYAALGIGCLDLFCATGELRWFDAAYKLAEAIERNFAKGSGLYYMSEQDVADVRSLDLYDSALPAGNSLAGNLFVKLYYLTGEKNLLAKAEHNVEALLPYLERMPTAFSQAMLTAEWLVHPPEQLVVVRPERVITSLPEYVYDPNRIVIHMCTDIQRTMPPIHPLRTLLDGKYSHDSNVTYFLCRNFTCDLPTTDINELKQALKKPWQK